MPKLIDVSKLNEQTIVYDKVLRTLPYISLGEVCRKFKFNLMDIQGKKARVLERRYAGGTQSYKVGKEFRNQDKLLAYESTVIEPKDVVFITKENSQKYDDNELLIVGGQNVSNITKRHPMEYKVVQALVNAHTEDVGYQLFHAERDEDSTAPSGAFDGLFTKIDRIVIAGDINVARGNLRTTGEFVHPVDGNDTTAYDQMVDFLAGANPFLRSARYGITQLICAESVMIAVRAAFRNKVKSFDYPTMEQVIEKLREDSRIEKLEVITDEIVGMGSRLTLQKAGNMDIAFNTQAAARFCQIRDIYEDPNEWQFWLQAGYDTGIGDWHEKVFMTNEQKNTPLDLSGDYCKTGGIQVNITGADGAKWGVSGKTAERASGEYMIGLTPGEYTLTFSTVAGKTAPTGKKATVVEGKVTEVDAAYT